MDSENPSAGRSRQVEAYVNVTYCAKTYPSLNASQNTLLSRSSPPPLTVAPPGTAVFTDALLAFPNALPPTTPLLPHTLSNRARGANRTSTSSHGSTFTPAGAPARPPYGEVAVLRCAIGGALAISLTTKLAAARIVSRCAETGFTPANDVLDAFRV